jgi:hypothetical protein
MADAAKSNFFDGSDSDEEAAGPMVSPEEMEFARADVIKAKEEGGQHFKDQNFEEALACYTTCVNTLKKAGLPRDPVILANRSATYLALKRYVPACHDAMQSAEVDPTNWKAHWRQGVAIMAMQAKKFRSKQAIEVLPAITLPCCHRQPPPLMMLLRPPRAPRLEYRHTSYIITNIPPPRHHHRHHRHCSNRPSRSVASAPTYPMRSRTMCVNSCTGPRRGSRSKTKLRRCPT